MPAASIREGDLQFDFDGSWAVLKWDDSRAYRLGIQRLVGSKAVDLVGVWTASTGAEYFLIEVKDFRKDPARNKSRIETDLAQEVAEKVRDTVAGLAGAHVSRQHEDWFRFIKFVPARVAPHVVLWAEEVPSIPGHGNRRVWEQRAKSHAAILLANIKKRISWITNRVMVYSLSRPEAGALPGVDVRNLAGAGTR